jgi:hypothetical protein
MDLGAGKAGLPYRISHGNPPLSTALKNFFSHLPLQSWIFFDILLVQPVMRDWVKSKYMGGSI